MDRGDLAEKYLSGFSIVELLFIFTPIFLFWGVMTAKNTMFPGMLFGLIHTLKLLYSGYGS